MFFDGFSPFRITTFFSIDILYIIWIIKWLLNRLNLPVERKPSNEWPLELFLALRLYLSNLRWLKTNESETNEK